MTWKEATPVLVLVKYQCTVRTVPVMRRSSISNIYLEPRMLTDAGHLLVVAAAAHSPPYSAATCPAAGSFKLADFGLARIFGSPDRRLTPQVCWLQTPC
jgi:hypothetical protein